MTASLDSNEMRNDGTQPPPGTPAGRRPGDHLPTGHACL